MSPAVYSVSANSGKSVGVRQSTALSWGYRMQRSDNAMRSALVDLAVPVILLAGAIGAGGAALAQVETPRQQCYCNGQYIEVPRGTDCASFCRERRPPLLLPPSSDFDQLRQSLDERSRTLLDELTAAERASSQIITDAVRRRYAEAIARRGELVGRVLALSARIGSLGDDLSALERRDSELASAVDELQAVISRLQTYRAELDGKVARLPIERRRLREEYLRAAARTRASQTAFWNALAAAAAPARLRPPRYYTPTIRAMPYDTQRRRLPTFGRVLAGPVASAVTANHGARAGDLARAIAPPPREMQPLIQEVIAVRDENVRKAQEVQSLEDERDTLTTRIDSLRPIVAARSAQQTQLTANRDRLTRQVDAASRQLFTGLAAIRPDFQAFWRTAKEELFWNAAVRTLEGIASVTTGRGEVLRNAVQQTVDDWDRVLSALPSAVADAGSPDAYPPNVQAYVLTMLYMYPEEEPLPTPRTPGEQRILDAARSGKGQEFMRREKLNDPFRPAEWGFRKKAYPFDRSDYPSRSDRQIHYWENEFTGRRFGFKFKDR